MEIRFALIPPARINALTAKLAKRYAQQAKHRFVVDNQKLFPHMTLFKVTVSKKNYLSLLQVVKRELKKFKPFNLEVKGFLISDGGWLGLKIESSSKLNKLAKELANAIERSKLTPAPLKNPYHPHITLTRFYKNGLAHAVVKDEPKPSAKFSADSIGLCLSRQTQVYKILNTVKLK